MEHSPSYIKELNKQGEFFSPSKNRHQALCSSGMRDDLASPGQKLMDVAPARAVVWPGSVGAFPPARAGCRGHVDQWQ